MKGPFKSYMSKYLSQGPGNKSIHGVPTGNHSNPNVLKRVNRASGGMVDGAQAKARLDRPGRKMPSAKLTKLTGDPGNAQSEADVRRVKQGMPKRDGSDGYASGGKVGTQSGAGSKDKMLADKFERMKKNSEKPFNNLYTETIPSVATEIKRAWQGKEWRNQAQNSSRSNDNNKIVTYPGGKVEFEDDPDSVAVGPGGWRARASGGKIGGSAHMDEGWKKGDATKRSDGSPFKKGGTVCRADGGGVGKEKIPAATNRSSDEGGWVPGDGTKHADGRAFAKGGKANWIKGAISKPGSLHREMGIPKGEKIPEKKLDKAAHSSNPTLKKRAVLAKTLKGFHKD